MMTSAEYGPANAERLSGCASISSSRSVRDLSEISNEGGEEPCRSKSSPHPRRERGPDPRPVRRRSCIGRTRICAAPASPTVSMPVGGRLPCLTLANLTAVACRRTIFGRSADRGVPVPRDPGDPTGRHELDALQAVLSGPDIIGLGAALVVITPIAWHDGGSWPTNNNSLSLSVTRSPRSREPSGGFHPRPRRFEDGLSGLPATTSRCATAIHPGNCPVPARFVIDGAGIMGSVEADPDHTHRPEPDGSRPPQSRVGLREFEVWSGQVFGVGRRRRARPGSSAPTAAQQRGAFPGCGRSPGFPPCRSLQRNRCGAAFTPLWPAAIIPIAPLWRSVPLRSLTEERLI